MDAILLFKINMSRVPPDSALLFPIKMTPSAHQAAVLMGVMELQAYPQPSPPYGGACRVDVGNLDAAAEAPEPPQSSIRRRGVSKGRMSRSRRRRKRSFMDGERNIP